MNNDPLDDTSPIIKNVDMHALAEFVSEGLATTGISDAADEILEAYFDHEGFEGVKKAQKHYNNAIAFRNEILGHLPEHGFLHDFITDKDLKEWGYTEAVICGECGQEKK